MTDKEKISWRQQAKLWVLQGILLVAAGISLFSTMAGFHTVFFPSSAMVAVLASLLVQGIELVCAERFHLAGCAAFLLSVAFSATGLPLPLPVCAVNLVIHSITHGKRGAAPQTVWS